MQREGKNPVWSALFRELDLLWKSLPEAERNKYKDRAKQPQGWSNNAGPTAGSHSNPVSLTSTVEPVASTSTGGGSQLEIETKADSKLDIKRKYCEIDLFDDEESERRDKRLKPLGGVPNHWKGVQPERYQDIELVRIREKCEAIIISRANNLISMPMYSFSTNVLCYKRDTGVYVPIEIGICAYSVKAGRLGRPYHALIDAGPPLEACVSLASDHADTHKITIPPKDSYPQGARKDYRKIYREIVDYTKAGERTILVWDVREMKQIIGCLEWLYEKASQQPGPGKLPKVSTWTVLPVMEFVANMCNYVHKNMLHNKEPVFIIHYYINMLLEISIYDYEKDLMCDYHKTVETKWCAKSCAIRMFLTIERVFEEIYKGFMLAINPEFLKARMAPLLYHQHRPSQQFLSDQANAASNREQPQSLASSQDSDQQQSQQEPMLALPAPTQAPASQGGNEVRMTIEDDAPAAPANAPEYQQPVTIPLEPVTNSENPILGDPRIRA